MYIHVKIETNENTYREIIMNTITKTKTDTETTLAARWWRYFINLEQAMDFDSQDYTYASLRQLRQTITTLEARVAELEAGRAVRLETEPRRITVVNKT